MLFIFDDRVCEGKLQDEFEGLCIFRRAELANSVDAAETFQPIPTGFHNELVRARSQLANCFADAGFQVKVEVFFFTENVFDAIVEFQFPVLGSFQVPNLLKPGFHGGPNFTRPHKFVQALIF